MALPFQNTFRNVRRYQQVLRVLVRYGFAGFVQETGLDRLLDRGFRLFGGETAPRAASMPTAERVRRALEELGPTFIKLGQILSTRRDLIPDDWAKEFSHLQDSVPADDWTLIRVRLEEEFGDELATLFTDISEKPLAAASMAQVHVAHRPDGREVVLKILRPGLHDIVESDMEALRFIAHHIEGHFKNLGVSPVEVVDEFARQLKRELDLTHEGRSTDRLRAAFAADPGVGFPEVHWDATTHSVLTLERIAGIPLSRADLTALTPEERRLAVDHGAKAVLRQCLELGFFHADPHPGNLFLLPGGKIVFIDMGMTGRIEPQTRKTIARLVHGTATGDVEEVARAALAIGDVDPETVDERALRQDVQEIVGFFHDIPLERFDLSELLEMFFSALRRHHVKVPADLALLIKALGSIEGVGKMIDPSFDMVSYVRPYIEKIMLEAASPLAIARRMRDSALAYAELAESLPQEIADLMTRLRRNRLTVNLEHRGLHDITSVIEHASRNIAFALTVAALVVGSSIIVLASRISGGALGWQIAGISGLVLAGLIALLFIHENRRFRRRELGPRK